MYSISRFSRLETAFIWFGGYLLIDLCVVCYVNAIVNYIVDGYYLHELVLGFGLATYRSEVIQYYPAMQSLFYIFGTILFIIWELHDNPVFCNDEKYMSRSKWKVLKDTCVHIIWTCIGLMVLGLVYRVVNVMAVGAM